MNERPGGDQPTAFSEAQQAGAGGIEPALEAPSELAADAGALNLPPEIARRTGVLFVHGIGTQPPAETFLDWSAPIVELLTDWRAAREEAKEREEAKAPPGSGARSRNRTPTRKVTTTRHQVKGRRAAVRPTKTRLRATSRNKSRQKKWSPQPVRPLL